MDEGWNNTGFSDLLAHVEMAAVDSGRGAQRGSNNAAGVVDGSSFPISHSPVDNGLQETSYNSMFLGLDLNIPIESNPWNDDMDYRHDIPQYEFPSLYRCSYDHSSLPGEAIADITSNGSIPLQLAPKTPGKRAQQSHHYEIENICQEEGSYLEKNKKQDAVDQIGHNTSELSCEETFLQYEPNFSSVVASTQLEENDVLDNAEEETGIDLHKTPAQKAKKRKIRPRVVLEGKFKGTPESNVKEKLNDYGAKKTPESKVKENSKDSESKKTSKSNVKEKPNGENQSGKRRYTRKNESKSSNAPSTHVVEEATTDQVVVKSCKRKLRFQYEGTRLTLLAGSELPPPDRCTGFNGSAGTKASHQLAQGQEAAVENSSVGTRLTLLAGSELPPPDRCTGFNGSAGTKASHQLAQGQEAAVENSSAVEFDFNFSCTELLEDYISLPENLSNCEVLQTRKSHGSHENDVLKVYKRKGTENNHNTVDSSLFSSMSSVLHGAREAMGCRQSDVNASPSASYITGQLELALPLYDLIDGNNEFSVAEKNAMVLYGGNGQMVSYEGLFDNSKKMLPRAKVDLDPEDERVCKLLMGIDTSNGVEGMSGDKEEWWEKQRNFFCEKANSFIARMHRIQGDRRFSKWNGSVLDSVIGVYLTQNASDHQSSSAFISLAARFPLKSTCYKGPEILVEEPEVSTVDSDDPINWQENMLSKPVSGQGFVAHHEAEHIDERMIGNCKESFESNYRDGSLDDICQGSHINICESGEMYHESLKKRIGIVTTETGCRSSVGAEDKRELDVPSSQGSVVSSQNLIDSSIFPSVLEDNDMGMLEDVVSSQDSVDSSILSIDELVSSYSERDPTTCCTSRSSSQVMQQAHSTSTNFQGETLHEKTNNVSKSKGSLEEEENKPFDWDSLRKEVYHKGLKREKTKKTMDSLDWEAVRCADVDEIAEIIKDRGMNKVLAGRIKDFLNRLVLEHESLDLEWLRDVPPNKAKDYLMSIKGVGLKSTECVRLLTLHHHAFPVDTNVGRIAVRLGWVPLQPLPESLQLHLLEMYPIMESIQMYLWPRLCTLDQPTLYELHYQMITFGKVFCTKLNPNCNACPMKAECKHYASAYASARLALPGPKEKGIVTSFSLPVNQNSAVMSKETMPVRLLEANPLSEIILRRNECEPIIEEPETIEDEYTEIIENDIEDGICVCPNEIPSINLDELLLNLQNYNNMEVQEGEVSKALVVVSSQVDANPVPKLKNVNRLRTEHQVYVLPDEHPLLEGVARRDPDDHFNYLFAMWSPGETAESFQPPKRCCSYQESSNLCNENTCFLCNGMHEAKTRTVRGTLLIPCRTAMRGSFPLNGTYFQVNEVFADHETSLNPINVRRDWIGHLPTRTVLFGTSLTTIVRGLSMEDIQKCFSKGNVCVRGFDQKLRVTRPLVARLHFPASKIIKNKTTKDTL